MRFIVECTIHEVILPISLHSVRKPYKELGQITELPHFQSDIDECSAITNPCHQNANCRDSDGSCICTCKTGFAGNGIQCVKLP